MRKSKFNLRFAAKRRTLPSNGHRHRRRLSIKGLVLLILSVAFLVLSFLPLLLIVPRLQDGSSTWLHSDWHEALPFFVTGPLFPKLDDDEPEWTVFYNLYLSPNATLAKAAHEIVYEQLSQIASSHAATTLTNRGSKRKRLSLYYNTIGAPLDEAWMQKACKANGNLRCRLMRHYDSANEDRTLSKLHRYCQEQPDKTVIYLHSKGSFHPTLLNPDMYQGQDAWRRAMTAASTSADCLQLKDGCNVCGLFFQPLPGLHFPGNMWSAKCSYVEKVLSPRAFHNRKIHLRRWIRKTKSFQTELFVDAQETMGLYRYEPEHWIGSHPSLVPCDVSETPSLQEWQDERLTEKDFVWSLAPRRPWTDPVWIQHSYTKNATVLENLPSRLSEYFLLRGALVRWWTYYDETPANSSWVWSWYPDGMLWKSGVDAYGRRVVDDALQDFTRIATLPP